MYLSLRDSNPLPRVRQVRVRLSSPNGYKSIGVHGVDKRKLEISHCFWIVLKF